jgi:predicted  nucleic acid-binding Zn-ribbon protein
MSRRGLVGALVRASKLQSCGRCGHTWFPRGHWRSSKCPRCGAFLVRASSSTSAADFGRGCLVLIAIPVAIGVIGAVGESAGATGVGALLVVGLSIPLIVSATKKRSARLLAEAEQRQLAAQEAENQRQLTAHAEEERREAQEAEQQRRFAEYVEGLKQRFGEQIAQLILAKTLWQGASGEVVREMFGEPADVATRVYKTKTTETWKFKPIDRRKYALHVTMENGICVGWKTT